MGLDGAGNGRIRQGRMVLSGAPILAREIGVAADRIFTNRTERTGSAIASSPTRTRRAGWPVPATPGGPWAHAPLTRHVQRRKTVECRNPVVGKNYSRQFQLQFAKKILTRIHPLQLDRQSIMAQHFLHLQGVHWNIFNKNNLDCTIHIGIPHLLRVCHNGRERAMVCYLWTKARAALRCARFTGADVAAR